MLLSLGKNVQPGGSLTPDLVLLGTESFGSLQAQELGLYVHLTGIVIGHRGLLLWVEEDITELP